MHHRLIVFGLCFVVFHFFSDAAHATVRSSCQSFDLVTYANSSVENPVSFGVASGVGTCTSNTTYLAGATVCASVVYIAPEDKQLFAIAMSAQTAGIKVNIAYEDNATTQSFGMTSPWNGSVLHCKLLAIWMDKTGY